MLSGHVGKHVPRVTLGLLVEDEVRSVSTESLFQGKSALIIGLPGAFTPVCSQRHIPLFVENADAFRSAGYDLVACITPNDPWTLRHWASEVDPLGKLTYLSDGNLHLARALGLTKEETFHFMGERCGRYLMKVRNAVIEQLNVERDILELTCTRPDTVLQKVA